MFRKEWRKSMMQSPCELLPCLPWPSALTRTCCHTGELSALITGLMSLQPLALNSVLSCLLPSELYWCPPTIRTMAIAGCMQRGVLDVTGILAPVFTSREHLMRLRDHIAPMRLNSFFSTDIIMGTSQTDIQSMPYAQYAISSNASLAHCLSETNDTSRKPQNLLNNHCHSHSPDLTTDDLSSGSIISQSPQSSDTSIQYIDSADTCTASLPIIMPAMTSHEPRIREPIPFLRRTWLEQGLGSPFCLPSSPCLTLQLSDICYDIFMLLPTLLSSFARSGMQIPRVVVSKGHTWPPPSDSDILATVPFLYALQPLRPLSLELSGLPLYLSDAMTWAPALSSMTQLTRLDIKLDTWKVLPGKALAASSTAMLRVQQYQHLAAAHDDSPSPPHSSPMSCHTANDPASPPTPSGCSEFPPHTHNGDVDPLTAAAVVAGHAAVYNSWMRAKAAAAWTVAAHLRALPRLRHLAIHSCSCEWTAVALRRLTCARHLSHLELHWIDNAQSAARHMLPAVIGLISAAFEDEPEGDSVGSARAGAAGTRRYSSAEMSAGSMASTAGTSSTSSSPMSSDMSGLSIAMHEPESPADGCADVIHGCHTCTPPLETLILCQVTSSSRQYNPGSGCLCDPAAHPLATLPAALGSPGSLQRIVEGVPDGALRRLQRLSITGLCVAVDELSPLVSAAPALTSIALPQTATLVWLPALAPLRCLQEVSVEYVPETAVHRAADALAAAGPPHAPPAGAAASAAAASPPMLRSWACCGAMRALELRRRRTLCRGSAFAVLAPQLGAFTGLTRLVWTEPLPARTVAGDWIAVLAAALKELRQLQHLEVRARPEGDPAGFAPFANTLGDLVHMTYLNMSVLDASGLVPALGRLSELRALSVKSLVHQELGPSVVALLDALPALPMLTSLRLSERRPWPKVPPWMLKRLLGCSSSTQGGDHGAPAAEHPQQRAPQGRRPSRGRAAWGLPPNSCAVAESRAGLLGGVGRAFAALATAPQLLSLRLEMPYLGDVVDALAPHLAGVSGLQRLELAEMGGAYLRAKRVLWPHVLGLPLRDGLRMW